MIGGPTVEVEPANKDHELVGEYEYDYTVYYEDLPEEEVYRVDAAADDGDVLIFPDTEIPDHVAGAVDEQTDYDWHWASEVNKTRIRPRDDILQVPESISVYYLDDPPSHRYQIVAKRDARNLLDYRGREYEQVEECWYYPESRDAMALITIKDDAGEYFQRITPVSNLNEREREIIDPQSDETGDEEPMSREEVAERIYENTPFGRRESDVLSCYYKGQSEPQQMQRAIDGDLSYGTIVKHRHDARLRQKMVLWAVQHVFPELPDDALVEGMDDVIDAVEDADLEDPEFFVDGDDAEGGE